MASRAAVEASRAALAARKRAAEARRKALAPEARAAVGPAFSSREGAERFVRDLDFWSAMGARAEIMTTCGSERSTSWEVELVFREDDAEARKRAKRIEAALLQDPRPRR